MRAIKILSLLLITACLGVTSCRAATTYPLLPTIDFNNKQKDFPDNEAMRASVRQKIVEPDFFMKANFEFALYHELAHALFDMLNIPVLGNEETAADRTAVFMILYPKDRSQDFEMIEKLAAVSGEWLVEWRERGETGNIAFWDYHPLEIQRFFEIGCILFGSNPVYLDKLRHEQFLPVERAITCRAEYFHVLKNAERIFQHWGRRNTGRPPSVMIHVEMEKPISDFNWKVYNWLTESGFVAITATKLSDLLDFPKPFTISLRNCKSPDAYWDYKSKQLLMCYELAEKFWINAGRVASTMQEQKGKEATLFSVHPNRSLRRHLQNISERTGKNESEVIELLLNQDLPNGPPNSTGKPPDN